MFKVVCINDRGGCLSGSRVVKDETYIVTRTGYQEETPSCYGYYYYVLKGIEGYWSAERFRPIDESFAEEVLEQIKEQINEENLVTI